MNTLIAFSFSSLAGLSTIIGALFIFFKLKESNINKFITFSIAFSLSIMIGISVTDLIPNSYFTILNEYNLNGFVIILVSFISGVGIVLLLNKFKLNNDNNLYRLGILNMIVLMIHNFPEGIATFLSSYNDLDMGIKLSIAIMFHNIPEGIAIAVPIYYSTGSRKKALQKTLISGLSEPLGAVIAFLFLSRYINEVMISIVLLFVAGIMITLSIHDMLPESLKYKCNKYIYLGMSGGVIFILISILLI